MRLIDVSEYSLKGAEIHWIEHDYHTINVHRKPLYEIPTVDAAPVIRCKDCKWYDTEYHCKLNGYGCGRSPDWFCADGKKEEEECTSTDTER